MRLAAEVALAVVVAVLVGASGLVGSVVVGLAAKVALAVVVAVLMCASGLIRSVVVRLAAEVALAVVVAVLVGASVAYIGRFVAVTAVAVIFAARNKCDGKQQRHK